MQVLIEKNGFKIEFNGSTTYFITDEHGDAWDCVTTERKAYNRFNKILKSSGLA